MNSITAALREILLEGKACNQTEILKALHAKGLNCSQPKISRLLNQIGAVKVVDDKGKTHYRLPHEAGLIHEMTYPQEKLLMQHWILSMVDNESLIVIHTSPGAAAMVARVIDQQRSSLGVLGTIAGDDTIFVSPKKIVDIKLIMDKLTTLLKL